MSDHLVSDFLNIPHLLQGIPCSKSGLALSARHCGWFLSAENPVALSEAKLQWQNTLSAERRLLQVCFALPICACLQKHKLLSQAMTPEPPLNHCRPC